MRFVPGSKWVVAALFFVALAIPLLTDNSYYLNMLIMVFIWSIAVSGMNIIAGYAGQLSLAHAGFFGIGAYTLGLLMVKAQMSFLVSLAVSVVLTGMVGAVVGMISLRLKGHYFAIFSLCMGVILSLVIEKWESLTEGVRGLLGIPVPKIGSVEFSTLTSQYYLILFFFVLAMFVNRQIIHSLVGRTFISIRNSEELAESLGIHAMKSKMLAFVYSTVLAGLAGALYAGYLRFLGPEIASIEHAFEMLLYLLVGGIGTLWGPVVGTALVMTLMQWLQSWQDYRMIIFGPILVLIVMFLPHGIMGAFAQLKKNQPSVLPDTTDDKNRGIERGVNDRRLAGGESDA
ncbi:branched-chain amino acid ABC transporter permease [Lihuaxuella thermophila]|uniref:Branched-chain amino acid transport system permease protein n=1 Tax=Lihuaxuella thermophila TaxID=1173111 RepID=A0A1H8C9E7_9BACL|nr:branched-chain amino acid ABC transporter permease [Lihuaxuella thermophila]SEM91675.1 branched-chain amino acid transport system permease protein [Lihuaxuella thermophila]